MKGQSILITAQTNMAANIKYLGPHLHDRCPPGAVVRKYPQKREPIMIPFWELVQDSTGKLGFNFALSVIATIAIEILERMAKSKALEENVKSAWQCRVPNPGGLDIV
uniref:Uncharacterized protein n=1 Tax=Homalodisca liturata TaxID=320908 RepID=A0A1B6JM51_9HEMI